VAVSSAAAWKLESLRLEDLAILRGVLALVPGPEACRLRRDVLVRLAPYLGEIGASDAESGLLGWMEAAPADPMIGDVNAALGALEWEVIDAIDGQFVATKGVRASVLASVMQNAKFSGIRPELVETLETHRDIEQVLDDARIKLERISRFIREQSDE